MTHHITARTAWGLGVAATLLAALLVALAAPASAGGPADKATGSGNWINGQNDDFSAEFDAHEAVDNRPAKGSLSQQRADGQGGFEVDVDTVNVFADYACFGGTTVDAWGIYGDRDGEYRWTLVADGGEGTSSAGDYLRGTWDSANTEPGFCTSNDPGGNEAWYGGNVQIHSGQSYQ